jgi:hypothetical protein
MAARPFIHAPEGGWRSALPDLIGCAFALLLAWALGWRTGDLIWSMWLASLVIGYSLILWKIFGPALLILRHRGELSDHVRNAPGKSAAGIGVMMIGAMFLLAFFTIHFGGFHWGHSIFVNSFYPISPVENGRDFSPTLADYWHVVKTYGWFLPLAFLAQRDLFEWPGDRSESMPDGTTRHAPSATEASDDHETRPGPRQRSGKPSNSPDMGAAYKGVIKLHLLIFFLFGADAFGLPEFLSYAVVYLVYFFPWRKIFGENNTTTSLTGRAGR